MSFLALKEERHKNCGKVINLWYKPEYFRVPHLKEIILVPNEEDEEEMEETEIEEMIMDIMRREFDYS
jgi:hypothetical protein